MIQLKTMPLTEVLVSNNAVALSSTSLPVSSVVIQAEYTNVGRIVVGDSTVTNTTGLELGPGDTTSISMESLHKQGEFDLADVYINSTTSGNKVRCLAFRRK